MSLSSLLCARAAKWGNGAEPQPPSQGPLSSPGAQETDAQASRKETGNEDQIWSPHAPAPPSPEGNRAEECQAPLGACSSGEIGQEEWRRAGVKGVGKYLTS